MDPFAEEPFMINGVKSWVHCLDCYRNKTDDKMKVQNYHYHDYIEFLYALDADMNVWINGTPYRMTSGDLIIINSDELHLSTFDRNSHYICVKFSPRVLYFDDNSLFEFKYVTPFLSTSADRKLFCRDDFDEIDIQSLCLEILDEWNRRRPAFELSIRANILKIFMGIFRYWEKETLYHTESVMTENIKKALVYILKHYDSVTESDVAKISGLSYHHFSAAFKRSVGRSFRDYVTLIRMTEAERLIISSDKDVTEIAYSCGFSSTSHFISIFKRLKGVTPGQLRKRIRQIAIDRDVLP